MCYLIRFDAATTNEPALGTFYILTILSSKPFDLADKAGAASLEDVCETVYNIHKTVSKENALLVFELK